MHTPSRFFTLHVVAAAILLTGVFMLATANELGAMGAIFVPLGIYVVFLALCLEAVFFIHLGLVRAWAMWQRRRAKREETGASVHSMLSA